MPHLPFPPGTGLGSAANVGHPPAASSPAALLPSENASILAEMHPMAGPRTGAADLIASLQRSPARPVLQGASAPPARSDAAGDSGFRFRAPSTLPARSKLRAIADGTADMSGETLVHT